MGQRYDDEDKLIVTVSLPVKRVQQILERRRAALRRDLKADLRTALGGEAMMGQRYDDEDKLIVTVSLPVKRVQQILGVVTVESSDVDSIVNAERKALAPIIGLTYPL